MIKINIVDFGAIANDTSVQTKQIQNAIDECFKQGGGEVIIPKGRFITGDIRLRSNITLHLLEDAQLLGSIDPDDYRNILTDEVEPYPDKWINNQILWKSPRIRTEDESKAIFDNGSSRWNDAIIKIEYAENVAVIGEKGSVIDGQNCFDAHGEQNYRGPHGINAHYSKNLYFSGYTIKNTGNWAHCIISSSNIEVNDLTVLAGHDGIHFRGCDNVIVKNCIVKTGDDCVAGFDNINMTVSDCEFNTACNIFRLGGTNICIDNCRAYGPAEYPFRGSLTDEEKKNRVSDTPNTRKNLASFFTYFVDNTRRVRHKPDNITINNCIVDGADRFFRLNMSGTELWQKGLPPANVTVENIKCSNPKHWIVAYGSSGESFNFKMKNIEYTVGPEFGEMPFMNCGNYDRIILENIFVKGFRGNKLIQTWGNPGDIVAENVKCDNPNEYELISALDEPFDERFI